MEFSKRKAATLASIESAEIDKSPKGSIDIPIIPLLKTINLHSSYFTTSSCSGRISILSQPSTTTTTTVNKKARGGSWLYISHEPADPNSITSLLFPSPDSTTSPPAHPHDLVFRFEPLIIAVECRDVSSAQGLVSLAISSGFRESGITNTNKRVIIAIRCSIRMEVPLGDTSRMMVSPEYVRYLVELANEKMEANRKRTDGFFQALLCNGFCKEVSEGGYEAVDGGENMHEESMCNESDDCSNVETVYANSGSTGDESQNAICNTINHLRKGLDEPADHRSRVEKILKHDLHLRSWERLKAQYVNHPIDFARPGPVTSSIRSEEITEPSSSREPTRQSPTRDHSARDSADGVNSTSDPEMARFGNLTPQINLDNISGSRKRGRLTQADSRPIGSSAGRNARASDTSRGSRDSVRATEPARGSSGGVKRKAPSEPRSEAPPHARPRVVLAAHTPPSSGRTPLSSGRTPSDGASNVPVSPTRGVDRLVPHKAGGSLGKQVETTSTQGTTPRVPSIFKEDGLELREDASFYGHSADAWKLLKGLHTPKDAEIMDQKTPMERQKLANFYTWRATMLLMMNEEPVEQGLEGRTELQDSLMKSQERVTQLSGELATTKSKAADAGVRSEQMKVNAAKLKLRADRLEDEVKELKKTRDRLEGELATSESSLEKKVDEARVEFQRQINEQVEKYYKMGIDKGYDNCLAEYDITEGDNVPLTDQSLKDQEDGSPLAALFPGLKDGSSSSKSGDTSMTLDQAIPPTRIEETVLDQDPARVETMASELGGAPSRAELNVELGDHGLNSNKGE